MSASWRSRGKMPQFYVDNDGKYYLFLSLSPTFCFPLLCNWYMLLRKKGVALFAIASSEKFLSLEQVLREDFKGGPTVSQSPFSGDTASYCQGWPCF